MDKFTIDLDKVLDEFEIHEDQDLMNQQLQQGYANPNMTAEQQFYMSQGIALQQMQQMPQTVDSIMGAGDPSSYYNHPSLYVNDDQMMSEEEMQRGLAELSMAAEEQRELIERHSNEVAAADAEMREAQLELSRVPRNIMDQDFHDIQLPVVGVFGANQTGYQQNVVQEMYNAPTSEIRNGESVVDGSTINIMDRVIPADFKLPEWDKVPVVMQNEYNIVMENPQEDNNKVTVKIDGHEKVLVEKNIDDGNIVIAVEEKLDENKEKLRETVAMVKEEQPIFTETVKIEATEQVADRVKVEQVTNDDKKENSTAVEGEGMSRVKVVVGEIEEDKIAKPIVTIVEGDNMRVVVDEIDDDEDFSDLTTDDSSTDSDYDNNEAVQALTAKIVDVKPVSFSTPVNISQAELQKMLEEIEQENIRANEAERLKKINDARDDDNTRFIGTIQCNVHDVENSEQFHPSCLRPPQEPRRRNSRSVETQAGYDTPSLSFGGKKSQESQTVEEHKPHRPKSLDLLPDIAEIPYQMVTIGPPGNTPASNVPSSGVINYSIPAEEQGACCLDYNLGAPGNVRENIVTVNAPPPTVIESIGIVAPFWIPDSDAASCMHCDARFNVIKRRHHCRACGKVLCSKCCDLKARLRYLDNVEARVCVTCYPLICAIQDEQANNSPAKVLGRAPNPNNPMEYCSTVPPLQQAAMLRNQQPPSVMVPVGVLKREGVVKPKNEAKQVMFSDGIRPGGDLTELDGWTDSAQQDSDASTSTSDPNEASEPNEPIEPNESNESIAPNESNESNPPNEAIEAKDPGDPEEAKEEEKEEEDPNEAVLVPPDIATYTIVSDTEPGAFNFESTADMSKLMATLRNDKEPPVVFALNKNLFVLVKITRLTCCVHKTVWCFTTRGLRCEGQDEMVFILEAFPNEKSIPKDVFAHIMTVFNEAGKAGNTVADLGHSTFQGPFLGSNDHGGFLYIRPTTQCLKRLILPPPPYLVAILLQRWETPWARLFPLRILLRLGYEYRYYPCPLISVRERPPTYGELGQTIFDILADFRNFKYTLPTVQGLFIQMDDKQTNVLIPRNRYDQVIRVINNSNEHVLAMGGVFCRDADSHLVCLQRPDETYYTKAISILNRPRKVTGASFIVFNGALKVSSGLSAKSSIVEDGLMIQITGENMADLINALKEMKDFKIACGPLNVEPPTEIVNIKWVEEDHYFNVGVRSQIDEMSMEGIPSIRVHSGTDYKGETCIIRWTEVFLIKCDENSGNVARAGPEFDISTVSESIAKAFCTALLPLLDILATAGLLVLAVRTNLDPDNVSYEAGSNGDRLPPMYMQNLDDELVPVIHNAATQAGEGNTVLELVFSVMRL